MNGDQNDLLETIARRVAIEPEYSLKAALSTLSGESPSIQDKVHQAYRFFTGLRGLCSILGIQYDNLQGDHARERMEVTAYRFVQQLTPTSA